MQRVSFNDVLLMNRGKTVAAAKLARFLIIIFVCACSSSPNSKHDNFVSCRVDNSKIIVEADTFNVYRYYLNVGSVIVDSGIFEKHIDFVIPKIVKGTNQNRKEIALEAAKNDYIHKIRLRVNESVDTTFTYQQHITEIPDENIGFTGFGAPLIRKSKYVNVDKDLRVWLYHRNERLYDDLFDSFSKIYSELSLTGYHEYVPVGNVPVVHDIDGYTYKINSNVQADYYAVVACKSQLYIDQFIEQAVGNNFEGLSTSLSMPFSCHYRKGTSGYRNVFLLCINKDWSYKQIPLATFVLDNTAPKSSFVGFPRRGVYPVHDYLSPPPVEPSSLIYKNEIKVIYPPNMPKIYGYASAFVDNWDGNGLECNVTFHVKFNGDTKSITIQRRGDLCYREYGGGYYLKQEDKVIYAKDHNGSCTFTYKMHFDDGDNIIPVIVEDYNGNKQKGNITVHAKFTRNNAPSINIDNNIDVYN